MTQKYLKGRKNKGDFFENLSRLKMLRTIQPINLFGKSSKKKKKYSAKQIDFHDLLKDAKNSEDKRAIWEKSPYAE